MELPKQANLNDIFRTLGQEAHINELWQALTHYNQRNIADREWLGKLSLFGAGLMVGAGLALLLASREENAADTATSSAEDLH